jgi:hypothetical protein
MADEPVAQGDGLGMFPLEWLKKMRAMAVVVW